MPKERRYGSRKTTTAEGKTEYQKDYMRDYRKRKKGGAIQEAKKLAVNIGKLLHAKAQLRHKLEENEHQLEEMSEIISSINFILNRTDLTEHEKIVRISAVPIPADLEQYFRELSKEIVT